MNQVCYMACLGLFFVAVPLLVAFRVSEPRRMPWWALIALAALIGWAFSNLSVYFYFRHMDDLLEQAGGVDSAPQSLIDAWQDDGAPRAVTLLAGWIYGLAYLGFCLLALAVVRAIVGSLRSKKRTSAAGR